MTTYLSSVRYSRRSQEHIKSNKNKSWSRQMSKVIRDIMWWDAPEDTDKYVY